MRLAVFGGTGGVGSHVLSQALDAGHDVVVHTRSPSRVQPHERLVIIEGQLGDSASIARTVEGADAVISALGTMSNTPDQVGVFGQAMVHITRAMVEHGVGRLVAISGAIVVFTPEDKMTLTRWAVGVVLRSMKRHVAAAKRREYEVITATNLDWVIVRPTQVVPGPATGTYQALPDRAPGARVSQGDVAEFMLKCTTGDEWVRRAPVLGSP